jgi:hypothetical protein
VELETGKLTLTLNTRAAPLGAARATLALPNTQSQR